MKWFLQRLEKQVLNAWFNRKIKRGNRNKQLVHNFLQSRNRQFDKRNLCRCMIGIKEEAQTKDLRFLLTVFTVVGKAGHISNQFIED